MREFNIVLRTEDGTYNPLDQAIVEHPELSREAALHFDLMPDGTSVLLYHLSGEAAELERILAEEESALSYDVFEVEGDGLRAHVRFAANTVLSAMIQLMDEYDLIVDPPVDIDEEGGLHMNVAGDFKKIQEAARMRPGDLDIELQEDDSGSVDRVDVTTMLTDRQLEVLAVALAKGYYEIPRQATNEDIAGELDCSTSTVGEHLRKIESRIISQVGPTDQ